MIVRILNKKMDADKLFDCRNSCLRKQKIGKVEEYSLIFEFTDEKAIEVVLNPGDEIYYMNDGGKTVHADYVMLNK